MSDTSTKMQDSESEESHRSAYLLKWLWRGYLRQHTPIIALAVFFMTIEGAMMGALAYLVQPMFDGVFVEGKTSMLYWVGAAVICIFVVRAIAAVAQKLLVARVSQKSAAHLRNDLVERIMKYDGAFHQTHPPGLLIQRVQGDVEQISKVWRTIILGAGRDFTGLIFLLAVAIQIDPIWALLTCIGIPLMVIPAGIAQRFIRRRAREARDIAANLSNRLNEVFHGIVQIKLNGAEIYQAQQYRRLNRENVRVQLKTVFGSAAIPAMIDVMTGLGFMTVIVYGGAEIIAGEKTIGEFMSFFTAIGLAFEPLRRLGSISGIWQIAASSIERLKELMEAPITLSSPENPVAAPQVTPGVVLKDVTLSYGNTQILNGLDLTAEAGKTTALVGASGAGKSTIFNLLTRLIDPDSGEVLIGGVSTTEMELGDLRSLFSVVTQESLLFDETLRENVLMGQDGISDAKLQTALDAAYVSDFVKNMPDGLDTLVGPRGSALSGGQRQRVVIARALLRDTPVLLLDEATSALDAQSENVVQEALDKLAKGRTTLVIAHRLSTVRGADKIIVMDRGRVVDEGTHDEMLERGGIYANLYRLQFENTKTSSDAPSIKPAVRSTPLA